MSTPPRDPEDEGHVGMKLCHNLTLKWFTYRAPKMLSRIVYHASPTLQPRPGRTSPFMGAPRPLRRFAEWWRRNSPLRKHWQSWSKNHHIWFSVVVAKLLLSPLPGRRALQFSRTPPPPGARPVTDPKQAMRRPPGRHALRPPPADPPPAWDEEAAKCLFENWEQDYRECPHFREPWGDALTGGIQWPNGYKLLHHKLYHLEKLCVPFARVVEVLDAHHRWNAHQGEARLLPDLEIHYEFPDQVDVPKTLQKVKKSLPCLSKMSGPDLVPQGSHCHDPHPASGNGIGFDGFIPDA